LAVSAANFPGVAGRRRFPEPMVRTDRHLPARENTFRGHYSWFRNRPVTGLGLIEGAFFRRRDMPGSCPAVRGWFVGDGFRGQYFRRAALPRSVSWGDRGPGGYAVDPRGTSEGELVVNGGWGTLLRRQRRGRGSGRHGSGALSVPNVYVRNRGQAGPHHQTDPGAAIPHRRPLRCLGQFGDGPLRPSRGGGTKKKTRAGKTR